MAAVLAGTGVYRDQHRNRMPADIDGDFEDEKEAWKPVLTNISLLLVASMHCLLAIISIYHASKRVCSCFRAKEPYNHNQFDPTFKNMPAPYVIQVTETPKEKQRPEQRARNHELCKDLEKKLNSSEGGTAEKLKEGRRIRKVEEVGKEQFGSANSKDRLVTSWLGKHHGTERARPRSGVRKMKMKPQPIVLVPAHPAHPASTMGRGVAVVVPPRYATLPLPPHAYPPPLYYPRHDMRGRRRRSPRGGASGAGGAERGERRRGGAARNSQLTRSLERIHRKRAAHLSEAELRRTYTGLDRTIAEQFIAVCDETRNHPQDKHDSSGFDTASSECHSNRF